MAVRDGEEQIALSEVISALSFALDLTEDAVPGHAIRSCLLGMRIGTALALPVATMSELYYALLLKDVGCSSNAARMCQILGGDDRSAKRRVKTVDWTRIGLDGIRLVWQNALPGAAAWRKFFRVLKMAVHRDRNNSELIGMRCERGAGIVRKIGLSEECAQAVYALDEHWNGSGYPGRLRGEAIPLLARILAVAQHLDFFALDQGRPRALAILAERSGTWFDPALVKIVLALDRDGRLWTGCESGPVRTLVMEMEPGSARQAGSRQIDLILEAFADVVDAKSPFTYRHSMRVTEAAVGLAFELGLPPARRRLIRRAALVHDLGKLGISNTILDKPSELTAQERMVMREHPRLSQQVLMRVPSFTAIAAIAGRHHERLDGSGYPLGLTAATLTLEDRIVAMADLYAALSEDRPYRRGLPDAQILEILGADVPHRLDPLCFEALQAYMLRKERSAGPTPIT